MMHSAEARFNASIKSAEVKNKLFGNDGAEDPVFSGKLKTREEEIQAKLALDTLRPNRSIVNALADSVSPYKLGSSLFSSDEEVKSM